MEDTVLEEFVEEIEEILQELEEGVLLLEDQPKKRSLIDQLFRNMHTIKGGAGMVQQKEMADYAHHFENLLDKARSGEIKGFTGIDAPYEAPNDPDLILTPENGLPEDGAKLVLQLLEM